VDVVWTLKATLVVIPSVDASGGNLRLSYVCIIFVSESLFLAMVVAIGDDDNISFGYWIGSPRSSSLAGAESIVGGEHDGI
jgi:hypothetical protein